MTSIDLHKLNVNTALQRRGWWASARPRVGPVPWVGGVGRGPHRLAELAKIDRRSQKLAGPTETEVCVWAGLAGSPKVGGNGEISAIGQLNP